MIVRLKKDDKSFKLKAGDILEVEPYFLDDGKYTVIKRLSDGFNPQCNVYKYEVEKIKLGGK